MLALEAGVPIVPMGIHGAREVLPLGSFDPDPGLIKVRIGKPINVTGYDTQNKDELIKRVRESVIALNIESGGLGAEENANPSISLEQLSQAESVESAPTLRQV